MHQVQLDQLQLGRCIAKGSQGRIIELADHPGTVAKIYRSRERPLVDGAALVQLVRLRAFINSRHLHVDHFAAWPHTVVRDGEIVAGFLMPRVEEPFMTGFGPSTALAELGLLVDPEEGRLPGLHELVLILRELASAMDALHRQHLVLGDLSPRNIAWSAAPDPRIMLLDCDGIRRFGDPGVLPPADTRGWEDPGNLGRPPSYDSDRFKLALAIARVLTTDRHAEPAARPDLSFAGDAGVMVGPLMRLMDQAAGPPGHRPTAAQWATVLDVGRPRLRTHPNLPQPRRSRSSSASGEILRPFRLPKR